MLITPHLLKVIIKGNGLLLGASMFKVTPLTMVQRCVKSQSFTHIQTYCNNDTYCVNCNEKHLSENCTEHLACINCKKNNIQQGALYNTKHKDSSIDCPYYKNIHKKERSRLNEIYLLKTPNQRTNDSSKTSKKNSQSKFQDINSESPKTGSKH